MQGMDELGSDRWEQQISGYKPGIKNGDGAMSERNDSGAEDELPEHDPAEHGRVTEVGRSADQRSAAHCFFTEGALSWD